MSDTAGCPCTFGGPITGHDGHCCYARDVPKAPAPLPCGHDDSSQWSDELREDTND